MDSHMMPAELILYFTSFTRQELEVTTLPHFVDRSTTDLYVSVWIYIPTAVSKIGWCAYFIVFLTQGFVFVIKWLN